MQKIMGAKTPQDLTKAKSSGNTKSSVDTKWVSRNMNIRLSRAQTNLYNSGIGLKTGYCMIGGHGTGKSMMIQLEVSRAAQVHTEQDHRR